MSLLIVVESHYLGAPGDGERGIGPLPPVQAPSTFRRAWMSCMGSNWDAGVLNPAQGNDCPSVKDARCQWRGLRELSLPLRYAHVLAWGRNDLVAALQAVRADGAPITPVFDAGRLRGPLHSTYNAHRSRH